jgi:hypothetical protein
MKTEIKEILINSLHEQLRELGDDENAHRTKTFNLKLKRGKLFNRIKKLEEHNFFSALGELPEHSIQDIKSLHWFIKDEERARKSDNTKLIDECVEVLNGIYGDGEGKYESREVRSLIRKLLVKIGDDELIQDFDNR